MKRVVVIGFGLGGLSLAKNLIREDPDAEITIVGDERPYVRHKLRLTIAGRDISVPTDKLEASGVRIIDGRAVKIKREQREVVLETGEALPYDYLVIATGAEPSQPPVPGGELTMGYRKIGDIERLREASPSRVAIVGASLVALHAADTCIHLGAEPHVIVRSRLVRKSLEPELSQELEERLSRVGVVFEKGKVKRITEDGVEIDSKMVEADLTIAAMGVSPEVELARDCGIELEGGWVIKVDRRGQTSDPRVYAVGDAALAYNPITGKPEYLAIGGAAAIMAFNAARAIAGKRGMMRTPRYIKDVFLGGNYLVSVGFTSPEAEKAGFEVDRVELRDTRWGDRAFFVFERESRKLLGFSSVSSRDIGEASVEAMRGVVRRKRVEELVGEVS